MKLTNRQILDASKTLTEIGEKENIDVVLGVTIARNNSELTRQAEPVNDQNRKLINKYGKKDEKGKLIIRGNSVALEDEENYNEEFKKLMDAECEVSLTAFSKEDIREMSPTPNQIMQLLPLMKE
jgi:hypothetical protein